MITQYLVMTSFYVRYKTHIIIKKFSEIFFVRFIAPHIFIAGMLSSAPEVGPLKSAVNHGIVSEECFKKTKGNYNGKRH